MRTLLGQLEVNFKIDVSYESTSRQHLKDPELIRAQTDALPNASNAAISGKDRHF